MTENEVVKALGALAQETRLRLFRQLVVAGNQGMTPGLMAERLQVSPTALSFHLKELSHAGLITPRQEGRFIIYAAQFDTMNGLLAFLTENCCGGRNCRPSTVPQRRKAS